MPPIRVLHFADVHIGMENYGKTDPETGLSTRVLDFLARMDEMIALAHTREADLIIFAGDAFKTRTPNPTFQREFAYRVLELADLAPVVMLVGNHDLHPTRLKASSIEIYDTLRVPNVWVAGEYEGRVIPTRRGEVYVATAPYPVRQRLLENDAVLGRTVAQIDELLQRQLGHILDQLAQQADQHGSIPRLLTGHFTVGGAVMGSERQIMLGRDIAVNLGDLADPRWDYVALGHIHKHQNLTHGRDGIPPVVYAGSIERIDFGEEGDPKGCCWVELARGSAQWEYVPLHARDFVTVWADLRDSDAPTQDAADLIKRHRLRETIARMHVKLRQEQEAAFNENLIREVFRQAGVSYLATVRKEIDSPDRARLGVSPEGLTHIELLEKYLISREIPTARREQLLAEADKLLHDEQD
jgi:exonuclease SbcD